MTSFSQIRQNKVPLMYKEELKAADKERRSIATTLKVLPRGSLDQMVQNFLHAVRYKEN